jgi:multiple sugar transport system ATP-binding protein
VQIGLRPEHISIGDGHDATIHRIEHLGDQTRLHLTLGEHCLVTLTDPHSSLTPGETLKIRPEKPLWFDAGGNRI